MVTRLLSRCSTWWARPGRRVVAAVVSIVLVAGLGAAAVGLLVPLWKAPGLDVGDPATGRDGQVRPRQPNRLAVAAPPEVTWPQVGRVDLTATARPQTMEVGGLPVSVAAVDGGHQQVSVEVVDRAATVAAGVSGVLLRVAGSGGPVELSVNYHAFASGYGGDYGSRLQIYHLAGCQTLTPACAASAQPLGSANDSEIDVVSATVEPSRSGTLLAIMAEDDSSQGDYQATALSPSSEWSAGGSSGAFNWSYPIATPPVPGELAPSIGLSYSSQTVDGRTAMTNNQGSWVGEGFGYEPGYIERRYKSCDDDGHAGKHDQCWAWDNATIMLNGSSGELVKDGSTWRVESDDGARVERLTGAVNGDDNGEYWRVTTTDGTQYFFGLHRLPGWSSGDPVTSSTWTVPVFGDDSGEPCHGASFASSYCSQAWRWNLDYVVDPRGNAMSYFYAKETNRYARNGDTGVDGTSYTRGGFLTRIEYGQRDGTLNDTPAPARARFEVAERCLPNGEVGCQPGELDDDTATHWPDVPWDRYCAAGTHCEATQVAPTFWTRKRLTGITTEVYSGGGYEAVDTWELGHSFVSNADLSRSLWLESITRTGRAGEGAEVTPPPTTLLPVQRPNRVDEVGDNISPMIRPRLATVYTESGGQIDVTYSGEDCTPGSTPSPSSNSRRCFPVRWQPRSAADLITDWFHKYVVTEVVVSDRVGESPDQVTRYDYLGGAAWRHAEPDGIRDEDALTWGQWRGYRSVRVTGAPGTTLATRTDHTYFRGMHGDDNGSGGTREVSVADSTGATHRDHDQLAGHQLEQVTYNGSQVVSKTITTPWRHVTATDSHSWGTQRAAFVRGDVTTGYVALQAGGWRTTRVDQDHDQTHGRLTRIDDRGDLSTTADDRCTRVEYADNPGAHMREYQSRVETVAVRCAGTPDRATDVLTDVRMLYDGGGFGQAPSQGLVTGTEELAAHDGTTATYVTVSGTQYDSYGRVTEQVDAAGNPTTTEYTDSAGLNVGQRVTNALGHVTSMVVDPARGQLVESVDVNELKTSLAYDGLGRLTGVWLPNRRKATGWSPNLKFSYHITGDAAVAVVTERLNLDGATYRAERGLFDGWLRQRQTQVPGPGGGRLVTDTFYDALGRVHRSNDLYYAAGAPSNTLLVVADGEVNGQTVTVYDRAGRLVEEIFQVAGQERWRTSLSYGGDRVHTTPPPGGTATTLVEDARGNPVELRQYHGGAPSGGYDATSYRHTPRGELAEVVDPAGNGWSYQYDQRGRRVASTDPDAGTTTYVYDDLGRLVSTTNARGVTLSHTYDALGRKTATYHGDPGVGTKLGQWFWDNFDLGQLAGSRSFEDGVTITATIPTRDYLYRPTTSRYRLDGAAVGELAGSYRFTTDYNIDHTVRSATFSAVGGLPAAGINYSYDELRRPVTVFDDVAYASQIDYYPTGQLAQLGLFAGATDAWQSFEYEKGTNRLARSFTSVEGVTGAVADIGYRYDPAGNLTSIVDDPGAAAGQRDAQCFEYDYLRRLTTAWTSAAAGDGSAACAGGPEVTGVAGPAPYWHDYGFDVVGNRTALTEHTTGLPAADVTTTYSYPPAGAAQPHTLQQAVSTGGSLQSFSYDPAGNTTSVERDGSVEALTWDPQGRLDSIEQEGAASEFVYDAEGNRVLQDGPDGMTLFLPGLEVHQSEGSSTVTATRYIDLPGGVTYVETTGSPPQYQVTDHHGTATLLIDPDTGKVTHRRMDPYGNPRGTEPAGWPGQRGFVGGTEDPTGYTHLGAREYNPVIGRFISLDPIMDLSDPQQIHGYAYANNNPITWSDPTGLLSDRWCVDVCGSKTDLDLLAFENPSRAAQQTGPVEPGGVGQSLQETAWHLFRRPYDRLPDYSKEVVRQSTFAVNSPQFYQAYKDEMSFASEGVYSIGEEVIGYADLDRCISGNWAGCGWLLVAVTPIKPVKWIKMLFRAVRGGGAAARTARVTPAPWTRLFCSFTAATEVLLADGSSKPIGEIEPGDQVWATDPETGREGPRSVLAVWVHKDTVVDLDLAGGGSVSTTADHPFWNQTDQQWQPAHTLDRGDQLLTPDGTTITVAGLNPATTRTETAYNLTINNIHTYHVLAGETPVLVHNTGCGRAAGDLGDLRPIHGIDPNRAAGLRGLSSDELINSFNNPTDGGFVLITGDGRIMNGHHRIAELLRRVQNGSISPTVTVRIDDYMPGMPSSGFWG